MIATNEIKIAVVKALACERWRVYDERAADAGLEDGPAVFVSVEPASSRFFGGGRMEERSVLVECAWVDSAAPARAAIYGALDDMVGRIGDRIRVGERCLKVQHMQYDTSDGVGRVLFELDFCDEARGAWENAGEGVMQELTLRRAF